MKHLETVLHLLMTNLLVISSERETTNPFSTTSSAWTTDTMVSDKQVTVHPSSTSNPFSVWITWPQSTNKVASTIQCSGYQSKVDFKTSDGVTMGMVEMKSYTKQLWIHCKEGGTKDWYGGNKLIFSTRSWGICRSGTTDTLIIERTALALKIWRGDEEVFSRNWAATDGKCLLKAGFWRLQNFGNTVLSAWSILGTVYLIIILNLYLPPRKIMLY